MPTTSHDSPRAAGPTPHGAAPSDRAGAGASSSGTGSPEAGAQEAGAPRAARPAPAELDAWLVETPAAPLRVGPGRTTFAARAADGTEVIVKRFQGDSRGERLRARLGLAPDRSPGRREHDALVALDALGLPVPQALGWRESGEDSLVVLERVPFDETLRERLARRPAEAARHLPAVLATVLGLHGAGWYHRDLYLDHFLVRAGDPRPTLIDVGRARRGDPPRARWFVKDLAALQHSTPAGVGPRPRLRLLARWLDARGVTGRRARRRWARAVLRKARRMAAHVPRGGTSFPGPEATP